MAIRTEMISIAMPQPAEAKFPGIRGVPNPVGFLQMGLGGGQDLGSLVQTGTLINSGVASVFTKDIEAFCQEWNESSEGPRGGISQIKKEGVSSTDHKSRPPSLGPRGASESRVGLRRLGGGWTHLAGLGWPSTQTLAPGWQTGPVTPLRRRWATQPKPASSGRG